MVIKRITTATIVLVAVAFSLTGCPSPCIEAVYDFQITASVRPSKDSVAVGDTIYLESYFPSKLIDTQSKVLVDYANAKSISGNIGFNDLSRINSTGTQNDSSTTKYFQYISFEGSIYNSRDIPIYWAVNQTRYEEKNSQYKLKLAIIPLKKGTYMLILGNALSNGRNGSKNCEKASFAINFSNTDQHLYYYENKFGNLSDADRRRSYCFTVY